MTTSNTDNPATTSPTRPGNTDAVGTTGTVEGVRESSGHQPYPTSGSFGGKEAEPFSASAEAIPLIELPTSPELSPEVETWIEKVESGQNSQFVQTIVHDDQVMVAHPSARVTTDEVLLPLNDEQIVSAQKHDVGESVRWLAEWCWRITKVLRVKKTI